VLIGGADPVELVDPNKFFKHGRHLLARRYFEWVIAESSCGISQDIASDEVDDGFEVSFGPIAFG
jgi:hypothetical protein